MGHGAAADSFIPTKLLMDIIFWTTYLLKVSTERQQTTQRSRQVSAGALSKPRPCRGTVCRSACGHACGLWPRLRLRQTVDCEGGGAVNNRYGGGHGAAANSFISTTLFMNIIFSTDLSKVSTERQQNHSTFNAGARRCTQ
jgi:hypothetical protein